MKSDSFRQSLAIEKKPYWVWGPLVFSSFYFLPLILSFEQFAALDIFIIVMIYITFIFYYVKAANAKGEDALIPVSIIVIIATFGTYLTLGTQTLFGFACYFFGFNFRQKKGVLGLVAVALSIFLAVYLFDLNNPYFIAPALIISIALYFMGRAERRERIHQLSEQKSQHQIEQLAMIAERERIARDLHDLAGHSLSSIALKAELAEKLIVNDNVEQAQSEIKQVAAISRDLLSDIRKAVTNMKQFNLTKQLEFFQEELTQNGFNVIVNNELTNLSTATQKTVSLIVTEACTNILRHSKGNEVLIDISKELISIKDNGIVTTFKSGNGINGIKQRTEALGGELIVENKKGFNLTMNFQANLS